MPLTSIASTSSAPKITYLPAATSKITSIVKRCLETLRDILTFPLRYLGSRTWSIPGIILRTPFILFKRLFISSPESLTEELFCNKGCPSTFEKELSPDELQPYFSHFCATAFVCNNNNDYLPPEWKCLSPKGLNFSVEGLESREDYFFDPITGFKACLLEKEKEVILVFSSMKGGKAPEQPTLGAGTTGSIIQSVMGTNPKVCDLADLLTKQVKKHSYFRKKLITLSGMCYGGHLAAYAALKHQLLAVCINSFFLGAGQQRELGKDRLMNAENQITHISVKGDFLSHSYLIRATDFLLSSVGVKMPGIFGKRYLIPSAYSSRHAIHTFALGSAMAHLGHDVRTKPIELARPKCL